MRSLRTRMLGRELEKSRVRAWTYWVDVDREKAVNAIVDGKEMTQEDINELVGEQMQQILEEVHEKEERP